MPTATFVEQWHTAARTSLGLFWMAFWAFGLGYLISSLIQVLVSRERMRRSMGEATPATVAAATAFGFASSSCSFAALATTRALFAKGAGLVPALAFLLASTNLVVELGIVIGVFLGWQFVVGEYVGGALLILVTWLLVAWTARRPFVEQARERARSLDDDSGEGELPDWRRLLTSREGWRRIASHYVMEWSMVWKDVAVGFTVAGAIAAFVPRAFFAALFVGSGEPDAGFGDVLLQAVVGPIAAFFTFIGSMGNVPLAAVLFGNGVAFAGVMAFLFSDLVVFPVLRIQAGYYGWRMALYIACVFFVALVAVAVVLHQGLDLLALLPDPATARQVTEREWFAADYTLWLGGAFVLATVAAVVVKARAHGLDLSPPKDLGGRLLLGLAVVAFAWLAGGLAAPTLTG